MTLNLQPKLIMLMLMLMLMLSRSRADELDAYFGIPSMVAFNRGENGLIRCFLKHPYTESAAEIYLHGATVTQVRGLRNQLPH